MRSIVLPLLALALLAPAGGRAGSDPAHGKAVDQVEPGVVDAATARRLVAEGVAVVDVRTPQEFAAGHVPGARNIPFDQMAQRFGELGPPSTPLVLYCHSGRRSGIAVQVLKSKGFTRLYDLQAYDRWVQSEPGKK